MLSRFRRFVLPTRFRPPRIILRLEALEDRTTPATFTVTDFNDPGAGSLRQAVLDANALVGTDDIVFQQGLNGVIALTAGEIPITDSVNIRGPGAGTIAVTGNNLSRIFNIVNNAATLNVSIVGMTLQQGNGGAAGNGGAILTDGENLTLDGMAFANNTVGGSGGAVGQIGGTLTVRNSIFTNNPAGAEGGALAAANGATVTIQGSTFVGNTANGGGAVTVVNAAGTVTISDSTFTNNIARPSALGDGGALALTNANGTLTNLTITGNTAADIGGGIFATGGSFNLTTSTVVSNTAAIAGGAALIGLGGNINRSTFANNTANATGGGGLLVDNAGIQINNCTFSGNRATGGIASPGGGMLLRNGGSVVLGVSTMNGNKASGAGGAVFLAGGSGPQTNLTSLSSILANSMDSIGLSDVARADGNQLFFASNSLIEVPGAVAVDPNAGNLIGVDPMLGPLADNGGPTQTHLLMAGSKAINAGGTLSQAGSVDQRGLPRLVGSALDMGSVELQTLPPVPPTPPTPPTPPQPQTPLPPARFNPNLLPPRAVAVGSAPGGARVFVFDAFGGLLFNIAPFARGWRGGARAALADVNGDAVPDIIVGAARGNAEVRVFDGTTGDLLTAFAALDTKPREGVYVAGGDVNGDGRAEVIVGASRGEQPLVEVWDGNTGRRAARFLNGNPRSRAGVTVAVADVTGDGIGDIITGTATGASTVVVRSGGTLQPVKAFIAFAPNFRPGITVSGADFNGDGRADIVVGTGRGGPPVVRIFDGVTAASLRDFVAFFPAPGGVGVAVSDLNGNGRPEVVATSARGLVSVIEVDSLREILRLGPFGGYPF